jgi:hypothetical protein
LGAQTQPNGGLARWRRVVRQLAGAFGVPQLAPDRKQAPLKFDRQCPAAAAGPAAMAARPSARTKRRIDDIGARAPALFAATLHPS